MVWIHPVIGGLAVALIVWLGTQGLRARHARPYARPSRARHRRTSKPVFALVVLAALGGTASVWFLRSDMKVSGSFHFWMGWCTALLMALLAWSGPELHVDADAKRLHPALGIAALVSGAITAALGLGLLP